jgi:hypothetical protein
MFGLTGLIRGNAPKSATHINCVSAGAVVGDDLKLSAGATKSGRTSRRLLDSKVIDFTVSEWCLNGPSCCRFATKVKSCSSFSCDLIRAAFYRI